MSLLQRLKNLWEWSKVDPHVLGAEMGQSIVEALSAPQPAEFVMPNRVVEVLQANPEAPLDDLITR